MTWIKICGISNIEDGLNAASLGVDALGFIFAPSSRRVKPEMAQKIIRALPNPLLKVGVFVNEHPEEVLRIVEYCGLNALQFHGDESRDYCQTFSLSVIKAIRIRNLGSLKDIDKYFDVRLLLDTYSPIQVGGTGTPFPWEVAIKAKEQRNFILSGGLNPLNVKEAIMKVRPLGVDVCSGVESAPGKKDLSKMIEFVKGVNEADETAR
jgi:phosphoribosylanthranilate isomerase